MEDFTVFTAQRNELQKRIYELTAENARLLQQRDAANAQLDLLLENMKDECTRNTHKGS